MTQEKFLEKFKKRLEKKINRQREDGKLLTNFEITTGIANDLGPYYQIVMTDTGHLISRTSLRDAYDQRELEDASVKDVCAEIVADTIDALLAEEQERREHDYMDLGFSAEPVVLPESVISDKKFPEFYEPVVLIEGGEQNDDDENFINDPERNCGIPYNGEYSTMTEFITEVTENLARKLRIPQEDIITFDETEGEDTYRVLTVVSSKEDVPKANLNNYYRAYRSSEEDDDKLMKKVIKYLKKQFEDYAEPHVTNTVAAPIQAEEPPMVRVTMQDVNEPVLPDLTADNACDSYEKLRNNCSLKLYNEIECPKNIVSFDEPFFHAKSVICYKGAPITETFANNLQEQFNIPTDEYLLQDLKNIMTDDARENSFHSLTQGIEGAKNPLVAIPQEYVLSPQLMKQAFEKLDIDDKSVFLYFGKDEALLFTFDLAGKDDFSNEEIRKYTYQMLKTTFKDNIRQGITDDIYSVSCGDSSDITLLSLNTGATETKSTVDGLTQAYEDAAEAQMVDI